MTPLHAPFDLKQGLIELPGASARAIWAFTCPTPECTCRTAIVLSAPGARDALAERGRPVADAWLGNGHYSQAAQDLPDVTAFAIDLDTHVLFPPVGDLPLDAALHPEVQEVVARIDDDVLDAIARVWHRGKGEEPPPEPGAGESKIEVEAWRPGDRVGWDETTTCLRGDTYIFGERSFEAVELYCVEANCNCGEVIVDFSPVVPRGAPRPGHAKFDGKEATLYPAHERQRERLAELWSAYRQHHPRYQERFRKRSDVMHGLAGRIVAAPAKPKAGRNEPCPCGSGKKFKKCCGSGEA
jgi:hypothetical protein